MDELVALIDEPMAATPEPGQETVVKKVTANRTALLAVASESAGTRRVKLVLERRDRNDQVEPSHAMAFLVTDPNRAEVEALLQRTRETLPDTRSTE